MRTVLKVGTVAAVAAGVLGTAPGAAVADQGCTGAAASTGAKVLQPFGEVVSTTAQAVGNFGQVVIRREATAPHDDCP